MELLYSKQTKLGNYIDLIGEPAEENILIVGVVHGDEPQGKYLIERYLEERYGFNFPLSPALSRKGRGSNSDILHKRAKELRQNSTDAEKKLWSILRANKLNNLHFKRQQPIGKYIVDFVCFSKKIIIELDGGQHGETENIKKDNERTKFLEQEGFHVIRIWNNEVLSNIEGTIDYIISSLAPCGRGVGRGVALKIPRRGKRGILFIPCLNPDGMQNNTRTNSNNVDINRNFPTQNWGKNEGDNATCDDETTNYFGGKSAGNEIETRFLIETIENYSPSLVMTLHAPYKIVNYDGPAQKEAEAISKIINYPVEASIGYPTPGSFGTWAGVERNIPTITLELDEEIPVQQLVKPAFEIFDYLKS